VSQCVAVQRWHAIFWSGWVCRGFFNSAEWNNDFAVPASGIRTVSAAHHDSSLTAAFRVNVGKLR
jgi:hypothetical protein